MTKPEKDKKDLIAGMQKDQGNEQKVVKGMNFGTPGFLQTEKKLEFVELKTQYSYKRNSYSGMSQMQTVEHFREELAKAGYSIQEWPLANPRTGDLCKGYLDIYDSNGKNVGAFSLSSRYVRDKWRDTQMGRVIVADPKLEKLLQDMGLEQGSPLKKVHVKGTSIAANLQEEIFAERKARAEWAENNRRVYKLYSY